MELQLVTMVIPEYVEGKLLSWRPVVDTKHVVVQITKLRNTKCLSICRQPGYFEITGLIDLIRKASFTRSIICTSNFTIKNSHDTY